MNRIFTEDEYICISLGKLGGFKDAIGYFRVRSLENKSRAFAQLYRVILL